MVDSALERLDQQTVVPGGCPGIIGVLNYSIGVLNDPMRWLSVGVPE